MSLVDIVRPGDSDDVADALHSHPELTASSPSVRSQVKKAALLYRRYLGRR